MNKRTISLLLLALPLMAMAQWHFPAFGEPQHMGNPPVHDPAMARGEDGKYYLFSTGMGIQVMSSDDMTEWHRERPVFSEAPVWATEMVRGYRGHTWAPDICHHDSLWYLYYSCSTFGKNESAIGLAVNRTLDPTSPLFCWEDRGLVIASHRHHDCWNAIDPNLALDHSSGKPYLVFGSFWDGIQMVELSHNDLQTPQTTPHTIARRWNHLYTLEEINNPQHFEIENGDTIEAADNAIEAPFIAYREGYYYLFVSQDYCCRGRRSTYRTVYGRSHDITGPYTDKEGMRMDEGGGTLLFGPDEQNYGIGHCAVYDMEGEWLLICHAYDKDAGGKASLFKRRLTLDEDGWIEVEEQSNTFEEGGIRYNITREGMKPSVEVTYLSKCSADNYAAEWITIPKRVKHNDTMYDVTAIGNYAFMGCHNLDSISMPDSILTIGDYAFAWCSKLASVRLPSNAKSIGTCAFSGCSSLTALHIPPGVEFIGNAAFSECSRLATINIPANVKSIGDYMFGGCTRLSSITIPSDVTSIGMEAFSGCKGLTSVTVPEGVSRIEDFTFNGCTGLRKMKLPRSLRHIGNHAYEKCSRLDSISLPAKVETVGDYMFMGCTKLRYVESQNSAPPAVHSLTFKGFDPPACSLAVPQGATEAYTSDEEWNHFRLTKEIAPNNAPTKH